MTLATEYAHFIRESRKAQLAHDAAAVRHLERLLTETAQRLRDDIRTTHRGILAERYRRQLLASLGNTLDTFRDDYKALLDAGIIESAKIVEAREQQLLQAVLNQRDAGSGIAQGALFNVSAADRSAAILQGLGVDIRFGDVPRRVLETAYARTYQDGLKLSQRLYNLDLSARRELADIVTSGLATGQSAREMAKAIAPRITAEGVDNVRFRAMRIARTEINTAYREGHLATATDESGNLKPWISAVGWRLSASHPRIDICDAWAGDDSEGLGPGNYLPGNLPPGHPNCLCYTVSVLAALPDEQFIRHAAKPDLVPESQRRYYGQTGLLQSSEE